MEGIGVRISKELEYCADCRKQGKDYMTVHVGIFKMPFCPECYEKFKATVAAGVKKENK